MAWTIEFDDRAVKELSRLDRQAAREIVGYLRRRIATADDPKLFGKPLLRDKAGLWRYRVGDYRVICSIESDRLVVLVVHVGHRKDVYG